MARRSSEEAAFSTTLAQELAKPLIQRDVGTIAACRQGLANFASLRGLASPRQAASMILPPLENRAVLYGAGTKSKSVHRMTFRQIKDWQGFDQGVSEIVEQLPTSPVDLPVQVFKGEHFDPPADEAEVRAPVNQVLRLASKTSERLPGGCRLRSLPGGRHRSHSYTDGTFTQRDLPEGSVTEIPFQHGCTEVKAVWQLDLSHEPNLREELQEDPQAAKEWNPAIQQVYGDAIVDSVGVMTVSNYDQYYFLKRYPGEKTIYSSPCISRESGRAIASAIYALKTAESLMARKQDYLTEALKQTPERGYRVHSDTDSNSDPSTADPEDPDWEFGWLGAHFTGGLQMLSVSSTSSPDPTAFLGQGRHGKVIKVSEGHCCKIYDKSRAGSTDAFVNEASMYDHLMELQGVAIPKVKARGLQSHTFNPVLVMEYVGGPLPETSTYRPDLFHQARMHLQSIHSYGVLMNDISRSSFLVRGSTLTVVDFSMASLDNSAEKARAELQQLTELFARG